MVQIAAAVGRGARIIVFDEPTSSLSQHEARAALRADRAAARDAASRCIYVSHRMDEIFRLCDTVTVLRDGRHVATRPTGELDEAALVQMMIGRRLDGVLPAAIVQARTGRGAAARRGAVEPGPASSDVSFTLRAGEVLGLAGLVGAGRSEIAQALFGLDPRRHRAGRRCDGTRGAARHARRRDARRHRPRARGSQAAGTGARR